MTSLGKILENFGVPLLRDIGAGRSLEGHEHIDAGPSNLRLTPRGVTKQAHQIPNQKEQVPETHTAGMNFCITGTAA